MLDGRVTSVGTSLAPNLYEVRLHPEDAAAFAGWDEALSREMETWLAELAFARGLSTVGPIQVRLVEDASVGRRSVRAEGRFAGGAAPAGKSRQCRSRPVPDRCDCSPSTPDVPHASLRSSPVTVGRAEDNDLVLADPEVSRHHARLEPDGQGWRADRPWEHQRDLGQWRAPERRHHRRWRRSGVRRRAVHRRCRMIETTHRSAHCRRLALRGTPHHVHRIDLSLPVRRAADHRARARCRRAGDGWG